MNTRLSAFAAIIMLLAVFSGCTRAATTNKFVDETSIRSWVDAPLEGEKLEAVPYEIVTHTNVPSGVFVVEIVINGAVVQTEAPDAMPTLAAVRYNWSPTVEGTYTIGVRGQDADGKWGDTSEVTVTVAAKTAVIMPPLSTAIIPDIPSVPVTAPVATGPVISDQTLSTDIIYYRGTGCGSLSADISVQATGGNGIMVVELKYRLQDKNTSQSSEWSVVNMQHPSEGRDKDLIWTTQLTADDIPGYASYSEAWVEMYFYAIDTQLHTSQTETSTQDLSLSACHTNQTTPPVIIRTQPIKLFDIQQDPRQEIIR